MKKIVEILLVLVVLLNILSVFYTTSYASPDPNVGSLISSASSASNPMSPGNDAFFQGINKIIGLLQIVGTGISLIVVSMLGIKYMQASPGEKAETKKEILPIVIGCVLVFGGVNVVAIIANFVAKVSG